MEAWLLPPQLGPKLRRGCRILRSSEHLPQFFNSENSQLTADHHLGLRWVTPPNCYFSF